MLEPRPALADSVEDRLRPGAVGDVRRGQVDHEQSPIGVDRDVALAPHGLLVGVVATQFGLRRLDGLAVEDAARCTGLASDTLAVEHQRHVVDGLEQHPAREAAKPPVDGLPRAEVGRQHPPAATYAAFPRAAHAEPFGCSAAAGHVADRVEHLVQVHADLASTLRRLREQRLDTFPLLVGQVAGVAKLAAVVTGAVLDRPHRAAPTNRGCHMESQPIPRTQHDRGRTLRGGFHINPGLGWDAGCVADAHVWCLWG